MTDMPTTTEMRAALQDWAAAVDSERVPRILGSAHRMSQLLERIATVHAGAEARSVVRSESYDHFGRPIHATRRASEHGVSVIHANGWIVATFPNGSQVRAMGKKVAREMRESTGHWPTGQHAFIGRVVAIQRGAAPGATVDARRGEHIADILNRFADEMEARRGRD